MSWWLAQEEGLGSESKEWWAVFKVTDNFECFHIKHHVIPNTISLFLRQDRYLHYSIFIQTFSVCWTCVFEVAGTRAEINPGRLHEYYWTEHLSQSAYSPKEKHSNSTLRLQMMWSTKYLKTCSPCPLHRMNAALSNTCFIHFIKKKREKRNLSDLQDLKLSVDKLHLPDGGKRVPLCKLNYGAKFQHKKIIIKQINRYKKVKTGDSNS